MFITSLFFLLPSSLYSSFFGGQGTLYNVLEALPFFSSGCFNFGFGGNSATTSVLFHFSGLFAL